MSDADTKAQREEFEAKKKLLTQLRIQLYRLHDEREKAFQEVKALREKTKSRLLSIRQLKEERDVLTKKVKESKEQRNKFNVEMKEKAQVKREVSDKKEEILGHLRIQSSNSPGKMREEIRRLETKIETEVIPFEKEKQFRKRIKELKAELIKIGQVQEALKEAHTASADFSEVRHKAQESHHQVQEFAQKSQECHEAINRLYDEMKQLRQEEKPLAEKHALVRLEGDRIKKELSEISTRVDELAKLFHEEREKSYQVKVQEKTAEVNEKIKKGKKLSMDDILAFQATKE